VNNDTLRAWWFARQGLDGSLTSAGASKVLERAGWSRSVGGASPYLGLFARAGITREQADKAVSKLDIHELPSARGCTYVVPKSDFALALKVGQTFQESGDIATAKRHLGVTEKELDKLSEKVVRALEKTSLDPKELKQLLGDSVRNLGDAGKKRGMTTTLPLVLGRLQSQGEIRRVPVDGRLDQQRYKYARWNPNPLAKCKLDDDEAFIELAKKYFRWIGPASVANFQWFSGLGVKAAKEAVSYLNLAPIAQNDDRMMFKDDLEQLKAFKPPKNEQYALVGSIDSILLHRRNIADLLEDKDTAQKMVGEKGLQQIGHLMDLTNHAILDRGRIVGLWEFDPFAGEIVWCSFIKPTPAMKKAVKQMQQFVSDQLGDARSFSLDGPEARKPKLAALRKLGGMA